jgi:hypothetical protein
MKSPKKVKAIKQTPAYFVSLKFGDTLLEGSGDTVLAALKAIKKPVKIVTKSVLTVSGGGKTHSRPLTVPMAIRLFYPAAQQHHAKNLSISLK